jgi:hypothetical protein
MDLCCARNARAIFAFSARTMLLAQQLSHCLIVIFLGVLGGSKPFSAPLRESFGDAIR